MANNLLYFKAVVYKDAVHRPLGADERLTTDSIPISGLPNNLIRAMADGLYVGSSASRAVYYVDDQNGTNAGDAGSKERPYRTLDYAMEQIGYVGGGVPEVGYVVALKAGGTFSLNKSRGIYGGVKFTFYGDPKYGDFNDPGTFGTMATYLPLDLKRPILNIGLDPDSVGGLACFVLNADSEGYRVRITFSGVRVNIPTGDYQTGAGSVVVVNQKTEGLVILEGTIINAPGDNSIYGFLSVLPSSTVFMYQFGSQFRIDDIQIGAQPTPPPTLIQLQRRKWFIRMHPDFTGSAQTGYDPLMIEASPGTGLLNLSWTDTPSATAVSGSTGQNTWPPLAGDSFGLGKYITHLNRDSQGRPLNVISGRLF